MVSTRYDHSSIRVLGEIEHIRKNVSLYIGGGNNPNHLIYELLDNALDEAQAGYANIIGIEIDTKKHVISIADNGRGIPIENDTIPTVATKLFSGGKFDKGESKAYGIASGLHGIGIVAVTALSDFMDIRVYRDSKYAYYRFENASVVKKSIVDYKETKPFSTQITFKPSKQYFDSLKCDIDILRDRVKLASAYVHNLKVILIVDGHREWIECDIDQYFQDEILGQDKNIINISPVINISSKEKDEELKVKLCWNFSASVTPRIIGCVNLLRVDQGTHILRLYDEIREVFDKIAQQDKLKFNKTDALLGLRSFISIMLYHPEYSSQTKERLSISKKKMDHLYTKIGIRLRDYLMSNIDIKNQLFSFFITYRKKQNAQNNIIKTNGRQVSRLCSVVDSKLKDCTSHNVSKSELFIVEGTSAGGTISQARDPTYHAILSLKGKIPNIATTKTDPFKNKEIVEIINALGTGIEPDFSIEGLRYGKIIFAQDADADGSHIAVLLMTVFLKLVPKLFEANCVYKSIMPLYGASPRSGFVPFYSEQEMLTYKKENPNIRITRYKGLGEMNPDQLKVCLLDENRRKLIRINPPNNRKKIFELMIRSDLKRDLV